MEVGHRGFRKSPEILSPTSFFLQVYGKRRDGGEAPATHSLCRRGSSMTPGRPPPAPGTSFLAAWRQLCPAIATLPKSQPVLSLGGAQSNPIFAKRHRGWKMGNGSEAPTACTISFLSLFKLAPFYARRLLRPCELHPFHSPTSFGPGPPGAGLPSGDWSRVGRRQLRRLEPLGSRRSHLPLTLCPSSSRGVRGGRENQPRKDPAGGKATLSMWPR